MGWGASSVLLNAGGVLPFASVVVAKASTVHVRYRALATTVPQSRSPTMAKK